MQGAFPEPITRLPEADIPLEGLRAYLSQAETHQVLFRVRDWGRGDDIARKLQDNGIVTNYQALPDDESFTDPSGIRTGVQEMTRFGMEEGDFEELASLVADLVVRGKEVKDAVASFRARFQEMRYCLPAEQAVPLAARLLDSALSHPGHAGALARALQGS